MRTFLLALLAGAALLPAQVVAATPPMRALILHLAPGDPSSARHRPAPPLLARLAQLQRAGHVRHVRSLWIANAVAVSADARGVAALRVRPEVRSIEPDAVLPIRPAGVPAAADVASTGAPTLWSRGVDGRGIVVATLDTGVDLSRGDLASHYRGGANSWFDAFGRQAPVDLSGHGSQVMQLITGGGGIGMAPGARFIAARIFNDTGASTVSGVHLAFQWLLDPDGNPATDDAPDVVNASWGSLLPACDTEFQPDMQALRAAGILPVVSAGNDGPAAQSDNSPGNLPEAFAVGAMAGAAEIAPFSSIGPSRCGGQFPALVAPGTGILGLSPAPLAGTSFSAPHVAGALALLLQIAPGLTADAQSALLTQSAVDLGVPGVDDTFGAGALDIEAAARLVSPSLDFDPPVLSGAVLSGTTLQVRADDAVSVIERGEWWVGPDPGIGAGAPMAAADGSLDSSGETLVASTDSLPPGPHVLGMRARDAAGNWSAIAELAIDQPALVTDLAVTALPLSPTSPRARLRLVATDGFEHGLRPWTRRVGRVGTPPAAAISGRRGLRATSAAGAQAFVSRRLPRTGAEVEFAFRVAPGTFSSAGAWVEVAAILSARGGALASVELRSLAGSPTQVRLSARTSGGTIARSVPEAIPKRTAGVVLAITPAHALLTVQGAASRRIARGVHGRPADAIALGLWRGGPPMSKGALDMDDVLVREGPAA